MNISFSKLVSDRVALLISLQDAENMLTICMLNYADIVGEL